MRTALVMGTVWLYSLWPTAAVAQEAEQRLTRQELLDLLPGARVSILFANKTSITWTNAKDGKLEAVAGRGAWSNAPDRTIASAGNWKVSEDGRYCARLGWKVVTDVQWLEWCRIVLRGADGRYILKSVSGYPDWQMTVLTETPPKTPTAEAP